MKIFKINSFKRIMSAENIPIAVVRNEKRFDVEFVNAMKVLIDLAWNGITNSNFMRHYLDTNTIDTISREPMKPHVFLKHLGQALFLAESLKKRGYNMRGYERVIQTLSETVTPVQFENIDENIANLKDIPTQSIPMTAFTREDVYPMYQNLYHKFLNEIRQKVNSIDYGDKINNTMQQAVRDDNFLLSPAALYKGSNGAVEAWNVFANQMKKTADDLLRHIFESKRIDVENFLDYNFNLIKTTLVQNFHNITPEIKNKIKEMQTDLTDEKGETRTLVPKSDTPPEKEEFYIELETQGEEYGSLGYLLALQMFFIVFYNKFNELPSKVQKPSEIS